MTPFWLVVWSAGTVAVAAVFVGEDVGRPVREWLARWFPSAGDVWSEDERESWVFRRLDRQGRVGPAGDIVDASGVLSGVKGREVLRGVAAGRLLRCAPCAAFWGCWLWVVPWMVAGGGWRGLPVPWVVWLAARWLTPAE